MEGLNADSLKMGGQNEEASFPMTIIIPTSSLCRAGGSLLALPPSPPAYLLMIPEVGNEGRRSEERESGLSFLSGRARAEGGVLKNEPDNEAARNKQTNSQAFRISHSGLVSGAAAIWEREADRADFSCIQCRN